MEIKNNLCYGVDENTPREYLYIDHIILRNYKNPENNIKIMKKLSNFNIYQYNYNNSLTSDYFFWQYVNDNGEKDFTHIDLCSYQKDMDSIYKMKNLLEIIKNLKIDVSIEVKLNDIRKYITKIDEEIAFNNEIKAKREVKSNE